MFEAKFDATCTAQERDFRAAAVALHTLLAQNYLARKAGRLAAICEEGILYSGLDWNRLSRPQELRVRCHFFLFFDLLLRC